MAAEKKKAKAEVRTKRVAEAKQVIVLLEEGMEEGKKPTQAAVIRALAANEFTVAEIAETIERPYRQVFGILWKDKQPKPEKKEKAPKKEEDAPKKDTKKDIKKKK